jgi:NAD(P)-dependent dehydrogenase (short-subunit alcohol dehydrogenase family)
MQIFKDRVALITGSTGEGMGRSIAFTLARDGAKVVLNYGTGHPNNSHAAEKVLSELRALGGKGYVFKADTRNDDEVRDMVAGVIRLYGRLDFLVCNAGGAWEVKDITECEPEEWRGVMQAEVDGAFHCIRHALPVMREAHFGRIVAVGIANADRMTGPPYDYLLGKTARTALIRSLAAQEITHGITCNVIAPGHMQHVTLRQAVEAAKRGNPWKRRAHALPQDVAETVRFLCTDEAAFITGSVIELAGSAMS